MQPQFWVDLWTRGKASFHRSDVHPYVLKYLDASAVSGRRVLVPLCGKTKDMLFLRRHAEHVVGVELVPKAVLEFFHENELPYRRSGEDRFDAEGLTLLCKDFFEITRSEVGRVDYVHDRASLVALPLDLRLRYIEKIKELMAPGAKQLLNTLEYGPRVIQEPPFSITPDDVRAYYADKFDIEHVEAPLLPHHPMVKKLGLEYLREHAFILTRR